MRDSQPCVFCGQPSPKPSAAPLCNRHYYALPRDLRHSLYRPKGDGFEGALEASLEWLAEQYGEQSNASQN